MRRAHRATALRKRGRLGRRHSRSSKAASASSSSSTLVHGRHALRRCAHRRLRRLRLCDRVETLSERPQIHPAIAAAARRQRLLLLLCCGARLRARTRIECCVRAEAIEGRESECIACVCVFCARGSEGTLSLSGAPSGTSHELLLLAQIRGRGAEV